MHFDEMVMSAVNVMIHSQTEHRLKGTLTEKANSLDLFTYKRHCTVKTVCFRTQNFVVSLKTGQKITYQCFLM